MIHFSQLCFNPAFTQMPDPAIIKLYQAWDLMQKGADKLGASSSYQFDLVHLGREVMSRMSDYMINRIANAYYNKDIEALQKALDDLYAYAADWDKLMGANEYFLLGKWLDDARKWGSTPDEEQHMEWCAKRQITDWGGLIGTYSVKEWAGVTTKSLPEWQLYVEELIKAIQDNRNIDMAAYEAKRLKLYEEWLNRKDVLPSEPQGDAVQISAEMLEKCGKLLEAYKKDSNYDNVLLQNTIYGMALNKAVTATATENGHPATMAVDGDLTLGSSWWAKAPASLTVDLGTPTVISGILLTTYWGDNRYYQYTIEVSEDGINWNMIIDESENIRVSEPSGRLYPLEDTVCRYVRLNMLKNSVNPSVHVVELKVLSSADMDTLTGKQK